MIFRLFVIIFSLVLLQSCASTNAKLPIDQVTQKVLRSYGLETDIVKPFSELQETSQRSDGRFLFELDGKPGIELLLDRDYWVLVTSEEDKHIDVFSYMFNPRDEQSALNIAIGSGVHERTDDSLAKDPGFSGIKRVNGVIANQKVIWRSWSDKNHMYSDCTLQVPLKTDTGKTIYKVVVSITANTETRRLALEESLASLKLWHSKN